MDNDARKNLENILNDTEDKKDEPNICKETKHENVIDISDVHPKLMIKNVIEKLKKGIHILIDKIKEDKKFRIKFILIVCLIMVTIIGCQINKPKDDDVSDSYADNIDDYEGSDSNSVDSVTGLPLVDYYADNDEVDRITYDLFEASYQINLSDDLTILDGYGIIDEYGSLRYFITAAEDDEGEKMVLVSDLEDDYGCIKTLYQYYDDPQDAIFYATNKLNRLRGYSIYRPSSSELEEITGL